MKLDAPAALIETPDGPPREKAWHGVVFMAATLLAMMTGLRGLSDYSTVPESALLGLALASYLPLFVRKRWPVAVLVTVTALEVMHLVLLPVLNPAVTSTTDVAVFQPVPVATMAAMYSLAVRREPTVVWAAGLTSAAALFTAAFILNPTNIATMLVMGNLVVIATAVGAGVRRRIMNRTRREQAQQQHVKREVLAERMRIARELHDVLAHNLTLVNAQAGVAIYLMETNPSAAEAALGNITLHTRKAIDDLRATVGLLREDTDTSENDGTWGAQTSAERRPGIQTNGLPGQRPKGLKPADLKPTHTLEHLPEMLETFRSAGNTVRDETHGTPVELPPLNDLSAYRIVQESLTNAAKHASRAQISVELRWHQTTLEITVTNGLPPSGAREYPRPHKAAGTGHGLIGMRERAVTAGGTFTAGPLPEGGFQVHARIPIKQHSIEGAS